MADPNYRAILEEQGAAEETAFRGPEESTQIVRDMDELMKTYASAFGG